MRFVITIIILMIFNVGNLSEARPIKDVINNYYYDYTFLGECHIALLDDIIDTPMDFENLTIISNKMPSYSGSKEHAVGMAHSIQNYNPYATVWDIGTGGFLDLHKRAVDHIIERKREGYPIGVIACPYAPFESIQEIIDSVKRLAEEDIIMVMSAGNKEVDISNHMLKYMEHDNLILVGSAQEMVTPSRRVAKKAWYSNYSDKVVDIFVPTEILVDYEPHLTDGWFAGTSAASGMLAGIISVMRSIAPDLTSLEIRNILIDTADPHHRLTDYSIAGGVVNVEKAYSMAYQLQSQLRTSGYYVQPNFGESLTRIRTRYSKVEMMKRERLLQQGWSSVRIISRAYLRNLSIEMYFNLETFKTVLQ